MSGAGLYILDNGVPVEVDTKEWAVWFEKNNDQRRVDLTVGDDGTRISTVFLGIDHSFNDGDAPVLYETMVFNSSGDEEHQDRCSTLNEAKEMHSAAVSKYLGE